PSTVVVYTNRGIAWSHGIHFSYTHFFTCFDWRRSHLVIIRHHTHDHFRHRGPWIRDQRDHFDHRKPDGDRRSRGDWVENREDFRWRHNPEHRRGVQYRHRDVRERFGGSLASIRMRTPERAAAVRYAPNPVHDRIRDRDGNGGRIRERIESKPLPSGIRSPRQDLRDRQHQAGSDERSRTVHEREREREIRRRPVERVRERNAERQVEAARLRQRLEKTREASPLPGGEREAVTRRRTETHNEWSQVRQRTRETPEMRRQEVREV